MPNTSANDVAAKVKRPVPGVEMESVMNNEVP